MPHDVNDAMCCVDPNYSVRPRQRKMHAESHMVLKYFHALSVSFNDSAVPALQVGDAVISYIYKS